MTEIEGNLRKCRFCGKEFLNLGAHIANQHPIILEQLNEFSDLETQKSTPQGVFMQPQGVKKSTSDLVREKLDLMFDIKILEMLAASKDATLQDLQKALQPAQPQPSAMDKLREIREYASIMNEIRGAGEVVESGGNEWIGLATAALPMIKEMLPKKQEIKPEVVKDVREGNTGVKSSLVRIQPQATGNTGKSGDIMRQPSNDGGNNKQDVVNNATN